MPQKRCKACGGTYDNEQLDTSRYFHVCPPLTVLGAQPDPTKPGYTPPTFIERPNKRDENIGSIDAQGKPTMKSAGDGVEEV